MHPFGLRGRSGGKFELPVGRIKAFSQEDLRLAERIGLHVAGVMANAHLYFDLQETAKSLRESEEKFRLLIENAPDAIFIHAETDLFT